MGIRQFHFISSTASNANFSNIVPHSRVLWKMLVTVNDFISTLLLLRYGLVLIDAREEYVIYHFFFILLFYFPISMWIDSARRYFFFSVPLILSNCRTHRNNCKMIIVMPRVSDKSVWRPSKKYFLTNSYLEPHFPFQIRVHHQNLIHKGFFDVWCR